MSTISQQQGKVTPHRRIPPKKQKRAAPPVTPNSGTTGRETSQIWDHFSKFIAKGGKCRAKCNYCTKTFAADSVNGTTTLWNHLTVKCLKSPFKSDKWQTTLKPIKRGWPEGGSTEKGVFNMDEIKRAITEFIIIDEQPFRAVEGEGFKKLMAKAFPNFEVPSRVTVARHCLRIYQEEKEKLKELIKNQRETIAKWIEDCLLGWGIENLFTVTLDNATANDAAIKSLKGRIEDWKGVMFENQFLHVRCNAHILNLIVKEGLDEQIEPISHIRSAIKYVRSSSSRFATFKSVVEKVKIDTRGLVSLDVETRWNSTYTMLDKALKFEKAFTRMYVDDQNYQKQCREISTTTKNPSTDDWKNVKAFVKFLNIFYQATLKFSGSLYSTSHSFFHDFFNLRNDIIKYTKHDDLILVDMATRMKSKMDKYWGKFESMNMLLMVAVVLDPRYKMQYVEYILSIAYGSLMGRLKSQDVRDVLNLLYNHYNCSCSEDPNENIENDNCVMGESSDLLQSQWEKHMNKEGFVVKKSDLEIYLKDDVVKINDFNILSWWKVSSSRYPIVVKIARDILSIPISTVASESAFSTGGRILDSYRSSLSPKTVEALICTQQWLRSPSKECKLEDILEEVQKIDEIEEEYPDSPLRID
ncbi:hypothetical protein KY285_023443 [Solanum tuberosum]|nr:hypothetical protein KY289_023777 [Solanum tuberosum]KAH0675642.1 hypothetical protein KY285_023443 [Solanum tuberosum]